MDRRLLGLSGIEVSVIGLEACSLGIALRASGQVDERESIATIDAALDHGINLIDTAPIDGMGHGEELVGKAVFSRRHDVLLSTKCGLRFASLNGEAPRRCLSASFVARECEYSLRRLRTDFVDLYQCHWPDPATPIAETMDAMGKLLDQGKIRAVGLCNFDCQQIAAARAAGTVHFVQTPFSLLNRRAAEDLLPYCAEHRVGVLGYGCLAGGLLTGKFTHHSRFSDHRARDPEYLGTRFSRNLRFVEDLKKIAERAERSPGQLAINWTVGIPGVTSALFGAKRTSQLAENVGGVGWASSDVTRAEVDALIRGPAGGG